jgi:hypothetical protein
MRHQPSEARGLRAGVENLAKLLQARFETAPVGARNEREQPPHFLASSFHGPLEFLASSQARRCFQPPRDQLDELSVRFRAQFNEFGAFRPGIHGIPAS